MTKILLLGGTGAMGKHLTTLLTNTNNEVSVTSRRYLKSHDNVTYIQGNAHNNKFLYTLLSQGFDVIVDFMVYNTPEFEKRYNLMLDSCKQYIFLSSARVYANNKGTITETSPRLLDTYTDQAYMSTDEYALYQSPTGELIDKFR